MPVNLDINQAVKDSLTLVIRLKGLRKFRIRCWLTLKLLELLSLIAPFTVEIEEDEALYQPTSN